MSDRCKCGSYAINPHMHGRDHTYLGLCDVCYWRSHTEILKRQVEVLVELVDKSNCCDFCGANKCSEGCHVSVANWSLEQAKKGTK